MKTRIAACLVVCCYSAYAVVEQLPKVNSNKTQVITQVAVNPIIEFNLWNALYGPFLLQNKYFDSYQMNALFICAMDNIQKSIKIIIIKKLAALKDAVHKLVCQICKSENNDKEKQIRAFCGCDENESQNIYAFLQNYTFDVIDCFKVLKKILRKKLDIEKIKQLSKVCKKKDIFTIYSTLIEQGLDEEVVFQIITNLCLCDDFVRHAHAVIDNSIELRVLKMLNNTIQEIRQEVNKGENKDDENNSKAEILKFFVENAARQHGLSDKQVKILVGSISWDEFLKNIENYVEPINDVTIVINGITYNAQIRDNLYHQVMENAKVINDYKSTSSEESDDNKKENSEEQI